MKTNFRNISILALVALMLVMASCGGEKKRKDGRTGYNNSWRNQLCM